MFFLAADFGEGDPLNGAHVLPSNKGPMGPEPMGPLFGDAIFLNIPLKGFYFAITGIWPRPFVPARLALPIWPVPIRQPVWE